MEWTESKVNTRVKKISAKLKSLVSIKSHYNVMKLKVMHASYF